METARLFFNIYAMGVFSVFVVIFLPTAIVECFVKVFASRIAICNSM